MGKNAFAVRLCQTQRSPRQHKVLLSPMLWGSLGPQWWCLRDYCWHSPSTLPPELLSCADQERVVLSLRGKQMNWQRRAVDASEGTEGLPSHCVCPLVTYRTYIIPSVEAPEVHGPLRSDLQKTASIAISGLVHIMKNERLSQILSK